MTSREREEKINYCRSIDRSFRCIEKNIMLLILLFLYVYMEATVFEWMNERTISLSLSLSLRFFLL